MGRRASVAHGQCADSADPLPNRDLASTIYAPGAAALAREFGVKSSAVAAFTVSISSESV